MRSLYALTFVLSIGISAPSTAWAGASGVGLGVAGGVAYSPTKVERAGEREAAGARVAWGFFVDIPLLSTFYISPAAMLYTLRDIDGDGHDDAVTDVDLNFKFIVPLGLLKLGAGVTAGLSAGLEEGYAPHYGALGYAAVNLVANLDAFALLQYKKLTREDDPGLDDWHGFLGAMFRF